MYILIGMVLLPALVIGLIEFPPMIKKKKYGNFIVVFSFWVAAIVLASVQIVGFELVNPLDTLVSMLPVFFKPLIVFLLP